MYQHGQCLLFLPTCRIWTKHVVVPVHVKEKPVCPPLLIMRARLTSTTAQKKKARQTLPAKKCNVSDKPRLSITNVNQSGSLKLLISIGVTGTTMHSG